MINSTLHGVIAATAVDTADGVAVVQVALHRALEDVVVAFVRRGGRVGLRQIESPAQFLQERDVVGALLPALLALPAGDESIHFLCGYVRRWDHPAYVRPHAPRL